VKREGNCGLNLGTVSAFVLPEGTFENHEWAYNNQDRCDSGIIFQTNIPRIFYESGTQNIWSHI